MGRPQALNEYPEIDLKLGIKSSLPRIKSTIGLFILLWKIANKPGELVYGEEVNGAIECESDLLNKFINAYGVLLTENNDEIKNIINNNQLFKSQCEALIVAFELVLKLGKFTFTDSRSLSSERTGGNRYSKCITYSSNMDLIDALISIDSISQEADKVLLSWAGFSVGSTSIEVEKSIKRMITVFAEGASFLLKDGENDIVFNLSSVYREILSVGNCEISSDAEAKGPLRILKSLLSDDLLLSIKNENGTIVENGISLDGYKNRVDTTLSLNPKRVNQQIDSDKQVNHNSDDAKNILLYGVPGVGKSYTIKTQYCDDKTHMERVVFHPDYTYSDFVGQILPTTNGEKISYPFIPGPFTRILKKAVENKKEQFYLIIEEINRGNAPAIFGEIFQLLDRNENGESEYQINNSDIAKTVYKDESEGIRIPANLNIIATMNTADQNVFTLDTAFKRRWRMRNIPNNIEECDYALNLICDRNIKWLEFATKINEKIIEFGEGNLGSEDNRLGSYFVKESELKDPKVFGEKVLMYLWNDAFKFDRSKIFKTEYKTLEQLLKAFESDIRFGVFLDTLGFDNTTINDQQMANSSDDTEISVSDYLQDKNPQMVSLYEKLSSQISSDISDMYIGAVKNYIAFRIQPNRTKNNNFAEIHIKQSKITINIKEPDVEELKIGRTLSPSYKWSLDYEISLEKEDDITLIKQAIINCYQNIKGQ